jgi:predicted RNA binding protein YcfA (HicA-like mRNA interferase family)
MSQRLPVVKPKQVIRALERGGFFIHHIAAPITFSSTLIVQ